MSINISDPLERAIYLGEALRMALRFQDASVASTDVLSLMGLLADNSLQQMLVDKDPLLADNSDTRIATQKALKAYVDATADRLAAANPVAADGGVHFSYSGALNAVNHFHAQGGPNGAGPVLAVVSSDSEVNLDAN